MVKILILEKAIMWYNGTIHLLAFILNTLPELYLIYLPESLFIKKNKWFGTIFFFNSHSTIIKKEINSSSIKKCNVYGINDKHL